jgi:hypothetical protein
MGFLLRIYFIGLIAFVPDPNGQKMTVLLVDGRNPYVASDGVLLPEHHPLLVARAAGCTGDCAGQERAVADVVYADDQTPAQRTDSLRQALGAGGSWVLDQSELRIVLPDSSPPPFHVAGAGPSAGEDAPGAAPTSDEDFAQVADVSALADRRLVADPALLEGPEKGRTVGLLRIAAGTVKAQRLAGFADDVVEFQFATASEFKEGVDVGMPTRTLADRVAVEIPIAGCSVRLEETNAETSARRSMTLSPNSCDGSVLEVAVLNLPRHGYQHGEVPGPSDAPVIDHHFELFYDLAESPPPRNRRPVPGYFHGPMTPRPHSSSPLLGLLGLEPNRGIWSSAQCPVARLLAR